jgi:tRNA (guanine-N7-)-methyltransferase
VGRRALPKMNPTVDYEPYLVNLDQLDAPLDPFKLFGKDQPLQIEVGSGKGLFLTNAAKANPAENFLGIEVAKKYARYAAYRFAANGSCNARMICGDGLQLFSDYLGNNIATAVHVYFPDPWWKERHKIRRVMRSEFVLDIARVLKPEGRFHFWTDVEEYFESTCTLVETSGCFDRAVLVTEAEARHDMDYRTHFERRMRLNGHPVFRCHFRVSGAA